MTTEQQPLTKEVSLRFPDGSVGPDAKDTGGGFDGNDEKTEPFSYLTRRDDYEPPIPEPPQSEIEQAARKGVDKNTGLTTQPKWLSVLKKRQAPWFWVRWACCNCLCNPRWTMTRAQWIWVRRAFQPPTTNHQPPAYYSRIHFCCAVRKSGLPGTARLVRVRGVGGDQRQGGGCL